MSSARANGRPVESTMLWTSRSMGFAPGSFGDSKRPTRTTDPLLFVRTNASARTGYRRRSCSHAAIASWRWPSSVKLINITLQRRSSVAAASGAGAASATSAASTGIGAVSPPPSPTRGAPGTVQLGPFAAGPDPETVVPEAFGDPTESPEPIASSEKRASGLSDPLGPCFFVEFGGVESQPATTNATVVQRRMVPLSITACDHNSRWRLELNC